jgi:formylglycine-generating enzyme required for sulfatase activity
VIYQGITQMMRVGEGPFVMGSIRGLQDENPEHEVLLDAFYIDRFEVTIGGYTGCVSAGACSAPPIVRSRTRSAYYGVPGLENFPVIYGTWQEAQTYCEWRGAHLPTEAQWEKAARWDPQAGRAREVPWLLEGAIDRYFLNYGGSLFGDTRAIDNYPQGASYYGIEDVSGNVAEWVYDWYGADFYDITPYANPTGPQDGTEKVFRGGSFASFGAELRPAARRHAPPDSREETLGFRCAFTPSGNPTQP